MSSIFAIRIKTIINKLLIADGWKQGDYMALSRESSFGVSFCRKPLRGAFFYDTRNAAQTEISAGAGINFFGVVFEVVELKEIS